MNKNYSFEIRQSPREQYLKIFTADQEDISPLMNLINRLCTVRKCNVTPSESIAHPGLTLTVYGKPMFNINEIKTEVINAVDCYYAPKKTILEKIVTEATFSGIEARIIEEIGKASTSIKVCMAWFTNERIKNALLERKDNGVEVRILVFDDGVNRKKGVDLGNIEHKMIKAERGGIMHRKYCVIDNHVVITGSYNWSDNAEFRNDENVLIVQDWKSANESTKNFNEQWNKF
ncbi:MAG: phospholipase D-like domain-containing protein [Muribaculum sp.]|nr:phospholipase D-like domain-containing protein [Muribaculum sp.]